MKRLLHPPFFALVALLLLATPVLTLAQDFDEDPEAGMEVAFDETGTGGEAAADEWPADEGDAVADGEGVADGEAIAEGEEPAEGEEVVEAEVDAWPEEVEAAAWAPQAPTQGTPSGAGLGAGGLVFLVVSVLFSVLLIAAGWKVLAKAGQPGWAILVPIYQLIVFCKAAGKPAWWFVLLLIPGVNIVIGLLLSLGLASKFGKGGGFGVGLFLLPVVFLPMLAFGGAAHEDGPAGPSGDVGDGEEGVYRAAPSATSKEITVFGVLTILAALCFLVLVVLQTVEFVHYGGDPSVWNPKP